MVCHCCIVPDIWAGCPTDNSMAKSGCPSEYLVGLDNRKPLISNTVIYIGMYEYLLQCLLFNTIRGFLLFGTFGIRQKIYCV